MLKVFRHDGLAVDHVSRGADALEVIRLEPYSAVVLDLSGINEGGKLGFGLPRAVAVVVLN